MNYVRKLKNTAHLVLAVCANILYFFPGKKMTIIGVTGTDGKTTTSTLIYHILKTAGKKAAVVSTIGAVIDGQRYDTGFHVTTPSPFSIQKYLRLAKEKGCSHIVLEVTSHALDQNRVWGIPFAVGVLTNITHEHLDYHKNYRAYVGTKLKLFKKSDLAVINSNGEWFEQTKATIPANKMRTYSLHGSNKNDVSLLNTPIQIKTKLIGDFNLENILAAIVTCDYLGIESNTIEKAIESFEAPIGRQEIFKKKGITIMIDFAHTPNSFESILPEVRKRTEGKLIHVFGSAGERDKGKRSEMGKAASYYDDVIILTAEDPRSESIKNINTDIKKGIKGFISREKEDVISGKTLVEIDNREEAISYAISVAIENDTIIITGKGHEKSMNYGNGEEDWSDQEAVKKYIKDK